jgi:hypothetical protein
LGEEGQDLRRRIPTVIDGDALLRLVAGVVRAANQPSEAVSMLDALGQLLQPLFVLELAAAAAERARVGSGELLQTLVTAQLAPKWRGAIAGPANPTVLRDPALVTKPDFTTDRVPFDLSSWSHSTITSPVDKWGSAWGCIGGTHLSMSQIDRFGSRYHIDSISPLDACAGQTLTIRGTDFGPAGRVSFESPDIKDPAFKLGDNDPAVLIGVTPKSWTATKIEVVVPEWATAGDVHLDAFTRHENPCTTIDVFRLGNSVLFQGGLAKVYQVSIGGVNVDLTSTTPRNLTPGDAVALTWHSSGGPTTRIKIQLIDDRNTVIWERNGLPGGFGGVVLPIPDLEPKEPRDGTLVFTATSNCGATRPLVLPVWLSVPPRLTIPYVEVTQGVQGDLGEVLAGRGMPTVAFKDTAVRVHLNCDRGGWFSNKLSRITGSLLVDGRRLAPTNVRVLIPPDRGFASVRGLSDPGITNDTLNFTIPAAWLTPGAHTLTVKLVCDDKSGRIEVGQTSSWTWVEKKAFRVRAIYMALYGSDAFMLDYARQALDYLPTPLTDIGIAAPRWFSHTYNLYDEDQWNDLADDLEDAWDDADEESGVRWLGIIPASERRPGMNLPINGISGVPSIAVLAMGDRPEAGAHELGHSVGLHHVHLPIGDNEPKDPYDEVDNGGMLRRAPFDVRPSKAVSLPAGDLMSYFLPVRPGITTWIRLLQRV